MKILIRSAEEVQQKNRRIDALKRLQSKLESEGVNCKIHKDHNCLDVFDESGLLVRQIYPRENGTKEVTRSYYEYVGPMKGDYKRLTRTVNQRQYTDADPYMKFIAYTNDPQDARRAEGKDVLQ